MGNDPWARLATLGTLNPVCGEARSLPKLSALVFSGHPAFRNCQRIQPIKYAGTCYRCERKLSPGQGYMEKSRGKWVVFC